MAAAFRGLDREALLPEFAGVLGEPGVTHVDVSCFSAAGLGITATELAGLVTRVDAAVTVLLEADDLLSALCGQIGSGGVRVPGRRVGLFIRSTNYMYAGQRRPLRSELGWLRLLPRDWREWPRLFHEVILPRGRVLDAALCLDEYFVASHRATHAWMPDLCQTSSWAQREVESAAGPAAGDFATTAERLQDFAEAHAGRELFVYFGTAFARRGYDTLLGLALRRRGCFVHCGRRNDEDDYESEVIRLRAELARRGDLFETGAFAADFAAADLFLSAPPAVVLPYRRHLGSSGVMLQALQVGRPVLVPARGLMGRRVVDQGLGIVYEPRDESALDRGVAALWARSPEAFAAPIARFLRYFSQEAVERAVVAAVEGVPGGADPPACDRGACARLPAARGAGVGGVP